MVTGQRFSNHDFTHAWLLQEFRSSETLLRKLNSQIWSTHQQLPFALLFCSYAFHAFHVEAWFYSLTSWIKIYTACSSSRLKQRFCVTHTSYICINTASPSSDMLAWEMLLRCCKVDLISQRQKHKIRSTLLNESLQDIYTQPWQCTWSSLRV